MRFLLLLMTLMIIIGTPVLAQNLLVNGGFDPDGDLTGWTQWSSQADRIAAKGVGWGGPFYWAVTDELAAEGSYSLNLTAPQGGSFGIYQAIDTVVGQAYEIKGKWLAPAGELHWVEVLFFSDDYRSLYWQLDDPNLDSVICKVDGWDMNGQTFGEWESITSGRWFPDGNGTNVVVATSNRMYVGLKVGAAGGGDGFVSAYFDDFSVVAVPEPGSIFVLVSGISALGLGIRRKSRS